MLLNFSIRYAKLRKISNLFSFIHPVLALTAHSFISEEANATINCSSRVKMIVDGNFSCVCRSVGGNPPRNITWYHDDGQIGDTSYGENTLNLTKMTKQKSGIYTCVVQSYIFKNEKSTEVTVYNGKYAVGRSAFRRKF